jgi:hypothetical protein
VGLDFAQVDVGHVASGRVVDPSEPSIENDEQGRLFLKKSGENF